MTISQDLSAIGCDKSYTDASKRIREHIAEQSATIDRLREALDRLEALLLDGWALGPFDWQRGVGGTGRWMQFRLYKSGQRAEGPSLLEAINALPMGPEG